MNRSTPPRSKVSLVLALMLLAGLAACGAQDGDAGFSEIALPAFSRDRVAQEAPVEVRRLLSGGDEFSFDEMSPSPDGRYITNVGWPDIAVVDLATGEQRPITGDVSHPGDTYPERSVFSPDGSRVAFGWLVILPDGGFHMEVRSIGVDGSDAKVHLSVEDGGGVWVEDWSSDGRYILVQTYSEDGSSSQIVTIDVNTNENRVVKSFAESGPGGSSFSPDGRFVAFDQRSEPNSRERDIFLVSTDGSQEAALVQSAGEERLLGWLPDGSGILFHRTAEDSRAIWKLPVQAGRPAGPPELVKDDVWQMTGLGFSDDSYFYGVTASRPGVHTASFDMETGRLLEPLTPLAESSGPPNGNAAWSPDGTRIAYAERGDDDVSHIIVRSVSGELLQDLTVEIDLRVPSLYSAWTVHGFLAGGVGPNGSGGINLISLETGAVRNLGRFDWSWVGSWTVSEDGTKVIVVPGGGPSSAVTEHDIATGTKRTLELDEYARARLESARRWWRGSVSPDGDKIAFPAAWDDDSQPTSPGIEIYSLSSGESRLIEGFSALNGNTLKWSTDSRYVFLEGAQDGNPGPDHLLQISVADGSVRNLITVPEGFRRLVNIQVNPDGRHIALHTGELRREIWRMTFNGGG